MASDPFFSAVIARRSIHATSAASPIPDSRINEIVQKAILHVPSTFNVQSARAVILLKEEHNRFWDYADEMVKATLPEPVYQQLKGRITLFKAAYGSVLFFEDQADLTALATQHQSVAPFIDEWSDHSSGMHQFAVWTALEAEGLGASLQHYNFLPAFSAKVQEEWNLSKEWKLKAQLVFGTPAAEPMVKTAKPLEDRVKMFGQ